MTFPWGTERRLNAYSEYLRMRFGGRVQKITIDAGFTCPNRDGTCGTGGCTFCDNSAFTPSYIDRARSITEQLQRGVEFHRKRYRKAVGYLAYFQSYTNTHSTLSTLKGAYEEALRFPGIAGIVVGTRPDCVDQEILDYLQELSRRTYLVVEYGIESVNDRTLLRVNRGHDVAKSAWAIHETARREIRVGGHVILGLPGENESDFLALPGLLSSWPLNNLKFHQLQVIRGTSMELEYRERPGDFCHFDLDSYLELMVRIVERLSPLIVLERIAGEVTPGMGIQEGWNVRYDEVLRTFENLLEQQDTWQGKYYEPTSG
jgi:radical SAM protein (TIGR01212 family)